MTANHANLKRVIWSFAISVLLLSVTMPGAPQAAQPDKQQLAQSCAAPPPDQVYCGLYNGECINCYASMPYYCPPQAGWPRGSCHQTVESAQGTCGQAYAICGRPVN